MEDLRKSAIQLRYATHADYVDLADVMFDAVRNGRSAYREAQRRAWVPERRYGEDWAARLDRQIIVVGESRAGVEGFMTLADDGYIDFAYVRPRTQGNGLFRRMIAKIEEQSILRGDKRLWVHASLMAEPAFTAMGFLIVEKQVVAIGPEHFERFEMTMNL